MPRARAMMTSAVNAATYLFLAKTYDAAAKQADQLARDIVKTNIKR
jgi:hypothetical protein